MSEVRQPDPWVQFMQLADSEPGLSNDERATNYQKASEAAAAAGSPGLAEKIQYDHMLFTMRGPSVQVNDRPRFGPRYISGDTVYPDLSILRKPEPLEYFAGRADQVKDPGVQATYLDFLWESREAGVVRPADSARRAILAYLSSATVQESSGHYFQSSAALNRALQLSRSISDDSLAVKVMDVMYTYANRLASDSATLRYILEVGEGLVANAAAMLSEEQRQNWQALAERAGNNFGAEGGDSRVLERRFLALRNSLTPGRHELRRAIAESFESESREKEGTSALVAAHFLDAALAKYQELGDKQKADELRVKLEGLQARAEGEFHVATAETLISNKEIDETITKLTEGTVDEVLGRMVHFFVPSTPLAIELTKHEVVEAPLTASLDTEVYSDDTRVFRSGSDLARRETAFVRHLQLLYHVKTSIYFERTFARLKEMGFTQADLHAYLAKSAIFTVGTLDAVVRGFALCEREEAFEAIYILVPQIEDMFRQVLQAVGRPVTVRNEMGGFRKRSLSTLFEEEIGPLRQLFGPHYCNYAFCFLLDARADNLRNKIAHGLIKPSDSDSLMVHLAVHNLLVLGSLRKTRTC